MSRNNFETTTVSGEYEITPLEYVIGLVDVRPKMILPVVDTGLKLLAEIPPVKDKDLPDFNGAIILLQGLQREAQQATETMRLTDEDIGSLAFAIGVIETDLERDVPRE